MSMMKFLQQNSCNNFVFIVSDLTGYFKNNNLLNTNFLLFWPCTSATKHFFDFQIIGDWVQMYFENMLPPRVLLKPSDECFCNFLNNDALL